jgi:hypothetical protein
MSNDKYLKEQMRKTILDYIKSRVECDSEYKTIMPNMMGLQIESTDNEIVRDVVVYGDEDDDSGKTVKRLGTGAYFIPEVNLDWIDSNWWNDNTMMSLQEATLAIAYDYLLQESVISPQLFANEYDAARFIYGVMDEIGDKDDFVKRVMTLLKDFYADISN